MAVVELAPPQPVPSEPLLSLVSESSHPHEVMIPLEGATIQAIVAGDPANPPVFLNHPLTWGASVYKRNIRNLAEGNFVVAINNPGYGNSKADDPDQEHSTEYYVDILHRVVDAFGFERVSLAGESMGGGVSLGFTLTYPERVHKLAVFGSHGLGTNITEGPLGDNAFSHGVERLAEMELWMLTHTPSLANSSELVRRLKASKSWLKNEVVPGKGFRTDYTPRLGEIEIPTLIGHGKHDPLIPIRWSRRAHERIPGSQLREYNCGHVPPLELPGRFNRDLSAFLAA